MTELEAVRLLHSPLSSPSARHDAKAELRGRGWPLLAIALAMGQEVWRTHPDPAPVATPAKLTYEEARDIANGT